MFLVQLAALALWTEKRYKPPVEADAWMDLLRGLTSEYTDDAPAAFRSRELVTQKVIQPLRGHVPDEVIDVLEPVIQQAVYGDKGTRKESRQTLLFGAPEIKWLAKEAERLANAANGEANMAAISAKVWKKQFLANIKVMRESAKLPAGLTSALFGRMVTSDTDANITAPVHVAHAFTVHEEEAESDFFTAIDDLSKDEPGADTIQETELTSGLFYGYTVVDIPGLLENLGNDVEMAGAVLYNLIHLIAEVSPGAKLGSTAPYGRASLMLLEAGDRQPRTLAEAYRCPCAPETPAAVVAMANYLSRLDEVYDTGEERHVLTLLDTELPPDERVGAGRFGLCCALLATRRELNARSLAGRRKS